MEGGFFRNSMIFGTTVVSLLIVSSATAVTLNSDTYFDGSVIDLHSGGTEYWALIVGVGVYAEHPDRETGSLYDAENMYETLTSYSHWPKEHVKVIVGTDATKRNIIKGLRWLDRMEDKDDVSLVYFSTHGGQLSLFGMPLDIPPFDEKDECDEILVTYYGFTNPFVNLRDDELNTYLSRLDSRAVCVIIDSCYAGGFNDPPRKRFLNKCFSISDNVEDSSTSVFMKEFSKEIMGDGRIVLMSSREDEASWGSGYGGRFTLALTESLQKGIGDLNNDGFISAEEAFKYARSMVVNSQHPTIHDGYNGELPLTTSRYKVDLFCDCESSCTEWTTVDHTGGYGFDLWHLSEIDSVSSTHCWYLGDETTRRYRNNMDNSLISPRITLGEKPFLLFILQGAIENCDALYLDVTLDDWETFSTTRLNPPCYWYPEYVSLHSGPFGNLSMKTIQMRFRFMSDESLPFNLEVGEGYVMIDDVQIYSEK